MIVIIGNDLVIMAHIYNDNGKNMIMIVTMNDSDSSDSYT